jgi:hypothetical protein
VSDRQIQQIGHGHDDADIETERHAQRTRLTEANGDAD